MKLRRIDRAAEEEWTRSFLHQAPVGVLATAVDGQPYVNSNLFVYDEERHAIYLHAARSGRTPDNLQEPASVAFTAFEMGRLLPADEALEFSVEYGGVVVFGIGRVVDDPIEAEHGLRRLLEKYAPHLIAGRDYRPITPGELERTSVFRIDIQSWSGKRKVAKSDFPGAFRYEDRERLAAEDSGRRPG